MPTQSALFDAASNAEGLARQLNLAAHLSVHGAPQASRNCTANAIAYLRKVADGLGFDISPRITPVQPAATPEAYGPHDHAASVGGL